MASSAAGPSYTPVQTHDQYIDPDVEIDPDDLSVDDPLDAPTPTHTTGGSSSSTSRLHPSNLTSRIPGIDRTAPLNTLDESTWTTLSRDLRSIYLHLLHVLYPRFLLTKKWPDATTMLESGGFNSLNQPVHLQNLNINNIPIHDWDLWGPLLFALTLSTLLSIAAPDAQSTDVFAGTFLLVWLGEALVTLQIKLLGGHISFFQSISVIGYTLFPMTIAALLSALGLPVVARLPVYAVMWAWSLAAGVSILGGSGVVQNRVGLAVFPLGVFYTALVTLCLF
ncbi:Yip1-domain-containing protein, partial [Terfezia boudieri ATCC MYA-4762]